MIEVNKKFDTITFIRRAFLIMGLFALLGGGFWIWPRHATIDQTLTVPEVIRIGEPIVLTVEGRNNVDTFADFDSTIRCGFVEFDYLGDLLRGVPVAKQDQVTKLTFGANEVDPLPPLPPRFAEISVTQLYQFHAL